MEHILVAEKILDGINLTIIQETSQENQAEQLQTSKIKKKAGFPHLDGSLDFDLVDREENQAEQLQTLKIKKKAGFPLREANISVDEGDITVIEGWANTGKTAFLKTVSGRGKLTQGEIIIREQPLSKIKRQNDLKIWKLQFANLVSDEFLNHETVYFNIELPLIILKIARKTRYRQVSRILESFQLVEHASKKPQDLSALQILALGCARSLIADPAIILIDDPVTNIQLISPDIAQADIRAAVNQILSLFHHLNRTVIITSREKIDYRPRTKFYRQIFSKLILS